MKPQPPHKPLRRVKSQASVHCIADRLTEFADEFARYRSRLLAIERVLSRLPALRRALRKLPRNLKAMYPDLMPFDRRSWSPDGRARPRHWRVAAAVEFLRKHPGTTVAQAADAYGVRRGSIYKSRPLRDLRLAQGQHLSRWVRVRPRRSRRGPPSPPSRLRA
jgi:hypothetical protein